MEGSPAKKQKQTAPMAITPPPLKRSYAAVVRNNINSSANDFSKKIKETSKSHHVPVEKRPIIVEAGLNGQNKKQNMHHNEDVHPYLCQLEQALELEAKYRVPAGDNPGGEMSGGITSGMRDGSAHVLRCLKVSYTFRLLRNTIFLVHDLSRVNFITSVVDSRKTSVLFIATYF